MKAGYVVHEGCDHVFFVGFLGAGKSTVARNLGDMFGRAYVDTDVLAERLCHQSQAEVYASCGEQVYRAAETQVLKNLKAEKSLLVACGGTLVQNPINCALMREMGYIVFLDGCLDDSLKQIQRLDKRPDISCREDADRLYGQLRPVYEEIADLAIPISGKTFEQVAQDTGRLLWERGLL